MPTTTTITHIPYEPATHEDALLLVLGYLGGRYGATPTNREGDQPCSAVRDGAS